MFKKLMLGICVCLLLVGCSAPQKSKERYSDMVFAMDTVMDLSVFSQDQTVLQEAESLILKLEKKLSTTDPESEIYRLNHTGSATLSADVTALLETALHFCEKTDGRLDLSIYPVLRTWGFTTGSYQVPSQAQLDSLLPLVNYRRVQVNKNTSIVTLPDGMEIDLGSVAKGYTGDRLVQLFRSKGIDSALMNLGGNVQTIGAKPDGTPWKIGLQNPMGDGNIGILSVVDQAVVTSGGYERFFQDDEGNYYWHIIDPSTGRPARSGLISATAVGRRGVYCDALSTALFIMGPKEAVAFWREHRDFEMILIKVDGEVLITPALADSFQLMDNPAFRLTVLADD